MLLAFVPGLAAALAITAAAREARRHVVTPAGRKTLTFNLREVRRAGLARALAAPALFELGNVATTLLILRVTGLLHAGGRSQAGAASLAIVLYAAHNAAATSAAVGAGHLADRADARAVFAAGAAVYIAGYLIFATRENTGRDARGGAALAEGAARWGAAHSYGRRSGRRGSHREQHVPMLSW